MAIAASVLLASLLVLTLLTTSMFLTSIYFTFRDSFTAEARAVLRDGADLSSRFA